MAEQADELFDRLDSKQSAGAYNFQHFRFEHLLEDAKRTVRAHGIQPGKLAPDFELPRADGGSVRLSELRGTPVLLHFGSFT